MRSVLPLVLLFALAAPSLWAQQVNDPGIIFDESKFDPDYPQMAEWATAGVRGGIPLVDALVVRRTLADGADSSAINAAINEVSGLGGGAVALENGTYNIHDEVQMKSGVYLVGESRSGVRCIIHPSMTANSGAFEFKSGISQSGIYRLTIEGGWGTPQYDWNEGISANNELPGNENISVFFKDVADCWIDDCTILNSADFPVRITADHITVRNCHIDGVFNKHGGAHGYFFILEGHNLVTGCFITHLRHISLQGDGVRYNVVYDNDFAQEVSFHSDDDGDNLIESNRIHLPADMPNDSPDYYAIMGPWSIQHQLSERPNYIYRNDVIEYNHGGATPWSDPSVVYYGPHEIKPANPHINFTPYAAGPPHGGTLYPIVLGDPVPVDGVTLTPETQTLMVYDTAALTATVAPSNASNRAVSWQSSDESVATVDAAGTVAGVSVGTATVTVVTVDGRHTDQSLVTVTPSDREVFPLNAVQDAYLQGGTRYDTDVLRVESGNRISYLMFDLRGIDGEISAAQLSLTVAADPGNGEIVIDRGGHSSWTETSLSPATAPLSAGRLAAKTATYASGTTYTWDLDLLSVTPGAMFSVIVTHLSGNDVSFISDEHTQVSSRPVLTVTVPSSLLDQWMAAHGLAYPGEDWDGDGFDNESEYICGTHPKDKDSFFRIEAGRVAGSAFEITLLSASNRVYAVDRGGHPDGPWEEMTNAVPGNGGPVNVVDPGADPRRIYRARVRMP